MDLFDFADQQNNKPEVYFPKLGDRVLIPSIEQFGYVNYIDQKTLFKNEYFPIQVLLDEPNDYSVLIRTNLTDIVKK
ncbi:hypothetical protein TCA2_4400 [Paenibacillus sp. TCA20]|uniref:hypothetical protein n=1 Tax=Paenibacillus sp. TCA20 TaxID=1499968 RepID=UPI0004D4B9C4|nr:hypothetical protein [Paenibacillus sp. TCA20]GAK41908.1 hypothetical protein TCA2_4400 [Paenibacillus sp. TCA20]